MSGNNPYVAAKTKANNVGDLDVVTRLIALALLKDYPYVHVFGSRFNGGWRFQSDFDFAVPEEDYLALRALAAALSVGFGVAIELRHSQYYDTYPGNSLQINRGEIDINDFAAN